MRLRQILVLAILFGAAVGCGADAPPISRLHAEIDSLRAELEVAQKEIEELRYGPERMLGEIRAALTAGDYDRVRLVADDLVHRHPGTPEATEAESLSRQATAAIEKQKREAEEQRLAAERERKRRLDAAVASLRKYHDSVKELTWYFSPPWTKNVNERTGILLYMGQNDSGGDPWLRFSIRYVADNWLFIQQYFIKADGRTWTITPQYGDVQRDHRYGDIWEWYDVYAGSEELEIARALSTAKNAVIRFEGRQYRRDHIITESEKRAIRNILDARDALIAASR